MKGPQWPKDKWYACHYCGAKHQGKFNLSRHHYAKHKEDLARDLKVSVQDVEEFFSINIRNENARAECEDCGAKLNKRYLKSQHKKVCPGK